MTTTKPTESVDLDRLEQLARAATPGPWSWWTSNSMLRLTGADGQDGGVLCPYYASGHADLECSAANQAYIAAANPATLLALIALARRAPAQQGADERAAFEATMGADILADQGESALSRAYSDGNPYTFLATKWAYRAWQAARATQPVGQVAPGADRDKLRELVEAYRCAPLVFKTGERSHTDIALDAIVEYVASVRPTDDHLWDETLRDRDTYHEWADKLAEAIAKHFDVDIGEHSNMNLPWSEALEVIESAAPTVAAAGPVDGLLAEILSLAEQGTCHGLTADDFCSQIVEKIKGAPGAVAAAGPVVSIDTPEFRELVNRIWLRWSPEGRDARTDDLIAHIDAKLAAAAGDARRWHFLVERFQQTTLPCFLERHLTHTYVADGKASIDAAIDAAMASPVGAVDQGGDRG